MSNSMILRFHRFYPCHFAPGQSNKILLRPAELEPELHWDLGSKEQCPKYQTKGWQT
jgi:hypothetical protein